MTAAAESFPEIAYVNVQMNPKATLALSGFMPDKFSAKFLDTERASSLRPVFHNARAYICNPSMLSSPRNFGTTC
jgi:hypothetical protein